MLNNRQLLTHATVVLPDGVVNRLDVLIEDGIICALDPVSTAGATRVDLSDRLLIPGLVDLHCDALEKEVEPRPGVNFPATFACAQADRRNAAAGITTIYHSLSFANHELGVRNNTFAQQLCETVQIWNGSALVDNRIHARYEVTDVTAVPHLQALLNQGQAQMISFMDHTPGQGQFKSRDAYMNFLKKTYAKSDEELIRLLEEKLESTQGGLGRMQQLSQLAQSKGVAIASHDDDHPDKVALLKSLGATISEFPINLDTAKAARALGLKTLFGAPNVLRGQSQSGSMRALDAVLNGVADCLCGDYSPAALLPAALRLTQLADMPLHDAIALVTCNPADAAGLKDRGRIAVGQRADLLAVDLEPEFAHIERVWSRGRLVFSALRPTGGATSPVQTTNAGNLTHV